MSKYESLSFTLIGIHWASLIYRLMFFITFWKFWPFLQMFFCLFYSFWCSHYMYFESYNVVPQICLHFLQFFCLFLKLDNFHQSVFKFTNSFFFYHLTLFLNPSGEFFFMLVIVVFNSRISPFSLKKSYLLKFS